MSGRPRERAARDGRLELAAALALSRVEGLGPARARVLVDLLGSARGVLAAARKDRLEAALSQSGGRFRALEPRVLEALRTARPVPPAALAQLARRGIRLVAYRGRGYPCRVGHLHDPPAVLYLKGRGRSVERCVAVVGTRSATEYGRRMARRIGTELAARGCTVVSGMARGIDGEAHRAALDAGGMTVGVLGSGLDHEYPRVNRRLYARMRDRGLLISEFPPAERPRPGWFPRRNRIIAALAHAVVVVQAGRKSGALNTAGHALDLGREVFAVPGPVGPRASEGVHGLLRDGAAPATSAADVLEALGWDAGDDPVQASTGPGGRLLGLLREGPAEADELAARSGLDVARVLARLGRLELNGQVRRLPGGRFERCAALDGATRAFGAPR